jgi:ABC-2 type transport system ATP-binding protein
MTHPFAIQTERLTKNYGKVKAVSDLTLNVTGQQITGFLGRNGAGKSTTIKMLLGMTHPTSGGGIVLGRRIDDPKENREMRRHVAYVAEDKQLYSYMTVEEMVRFTRSFYDDWRQDLEQRLLKQYELPLRRKVKALSKGMRTKLALLLALARRPRLLILDEPSEGLDPVSIEELLQTLVAVAAEGTTVFFSSHQIAEVERIADHVCMIHHGKLVFDLSLDRLREDYRRITLSFAAQPPPAEQFDFDGIARVRTDGRQITLIASHNAQAVVERARVLRPFSVDVEPVGLREAFLETVKEEA